MHTKSAHLLKIKGNKKSLSSLKGLILLVPGIGLEPIRPQWTQDFKSCVSTNSTTWAFSAVKKKPLKKERYSLGAKDEVRTRDLDLGKVALYQLSYFRINLGCKSKKKFKPAKKFLKSFVNLMQILIKNLTNEA